MSLKSERELNPTHRGSYAKAKQASQSNNDDFCIMLMQGILKDEPLFLEGRRFLRKVEVKKYKALSSFNRQMLSMKVSTAAMKLPSAGKKEPGELLVAAEEILAMDPYNAKANTLIAEAGGLLGEPEFKAFAYETLAEGKPDKVTMNALAQAYMEMKDPARAVKTYEAILAIDQKDGDALSGLKNALSADASKSGGWDMAGTGQESYRTVLKDLKESEQLEAESKNVKSHEAIDAQIQVNYERHLQDPTNPAYSKAIGKLYVDKNDYTSAIGWYTHAFEAGGKIDSSMEKLIGDLMLKKTEGELHAYRTALAEQTDPDQQAAYQAAIDEKKAELDQVRLFQAEARVRSQPNDGEFRYDLGEALFKIGQYKRATEELQLSLKQPSVRYNALNLMGLSFLHRGMLDFAITRLALAESELPGMDNLKKEVTYNLGLAYEAAKKPEQALEQWKKIYEYDMGYRDVAKRVEDSYEQGQQ